MTINKGKIAIYALIVFQIFFFSISGVILQQTTNKQGKDLELLNARKDDLALSNQKLENLMLSLNETIQESMNTTNYLNEALSFAESEAKLLAAQQEFAALAKEQIQLNPPAPAPVVTQAPTRVTTSAS